MLSELSTSPQQALSCLNALPAALQMRSGLAAKNSSRYVKLMASMPLVEQIRHIVRGLGATDADEMSVVQLAKLAVTPGSLRRIVGPVRSQLAESVGDFPSILADTINKTLRASYDDGPRTWPVWAEKKTAPDFKTITRAVLSDLPNLANRDAGGEIQYVTILDSKETYVLGNYASGLKLTERSIINDDLDAFSRVPKLMGNTAARLEEDVAYSVLTSNANLSDGNALFSSAHSNIVSATGSVGIPTVTTLAATETAMLKQRGPQGGAYLEIPARFMIVPDSLKRVTQQLLQSRVDPALHNPTPNPFFGVIDFVSSPRLDQNSTMRWYLLADYREQRISMIEMCFLKNQEAPQLTQETDFETGDLKYKITHTVAAKAIDFHGMVRNGA
jgi:hypothetical protein